jgi:hypothetical protein
MVNENKQGLRRNIPEARRRAALVAGMNPLRQRIRFGRRLAEPEQQSKSNSLYSYANQ